MVLYLMVLCIHRRVLLMCLCFKEVLLIAIMQMYHIPIKNYVTFLIYFSVSSRHCYSPWLLLTLIALTVVATHPHCPHRGCHPPSLLLTVVATHRHCEKLFASKQSTPQAKLGTWIVSAQKDAPH